MEMENEVSRDRTLWSQRALLPSLPTWAVLVLSLGVSLVSGFLCAGWLMLPGFIVCVPAYTVLLVQYRRPWLVLVPMASYGIAFLLMTPAYWFAALSAVAFAPVSVIAAVCLFRRRRCERALLWTTLFLLAWTLMILALALCVTYGSVFGGARELWRETEELFRQTIRDTTENTSLPVSLSTVYNDYLKDLEESVEAMPYLLPGMLIEGLMVSCWASLKLTRKALLKSKAHDFFIRKNWNIMVPVWWAYAYVGVTVLSLAAVFLPETWERKVSFLTADLTILLEFPLFLIGLRRIRIAIRKSRRSGASVSAAGVIGLAIVLFLCQPRLPLLLIACVGIFYLIMRARAKKNPTSFPEPPDAPES